MPLTMIDDWAFWGCTSLTSVTIPSSLRALGYSAFYGCNQLTIYGSAGTFLESYAKERQIPFLPANSYKPVDTVFLDVPPNSYYADAVKWAVDRGITSGTSQTTFSPNATCSDAEIITFLWRAVGSPQPTIANPYYDLKESDFYYKAALWSTEAGLRSGSAFGGSAPCNRWVTVVYLWNLAGQPEATGSYFIDLPDVPVIQTAVSWAIQQGITSGTSSNTFSPDEICTRAQIITFLYRAYAR